MSSRAAPGTASAPGAARAGAGGLGGLRRLGEAAPVASAATREVVRVRWLDTCWEGGDVSAGTVVGGVEPHCTRSSASTSRCRRGAASRLGGDERASSQKPTLHVRPTRNVAKTGLLPSWCRRQDWCAPMRHIWAMCFNRILDVNNTEDPDAAGAPPLEASVRHERTLGGVGPIP